MSERAVLLCQDTAGALRHVLQYMQGVRGLPTPGPRSAWLHCVALHGGGGSLGAEKTTEQ